MIAQSLNQHCHCLSVAALAAGSVGAGEPQPAESGEGASLFAGSPVFIDARELSEVRALVRAVFEVTRLPGFIGEALAHAPAIARVDQGTKGILHGFDFHLTEDGPRLIEVNTNAGGVLLNSALRVGGSPCWELVSPFVDVFDPPLAEAAIVAGFRAEFARVRGPGAELRSVAIVDEAPATQFLFREFELFQALFEAHGIRAWIVDPSELRHRDGALLLGEQRIDLVYNRLTDFYLSQVNSQQLAAAYSAGDVVLTPTPRAHALLANKRHLAAFCDAQRLAQWGASAEAISTLTRLTPAAELVDESNRARLYEERKRLFFKPLTGYGSKAAYRGDKLTRGKFDEILAGNYLAQHIVPPSERVIRTAEGPKRLKLDLRAYVVEDRCVLLAARLYQGQTTNFRTPGGGFAPVLALSHEIECPDPEVGKSVVS